MLIRRILQSFLKSSKRSGINDAIAEPAASGQPEVLPATAQQLEKQCIYLKRTGTDLAAIWGGEGVVPPPPGPYRHWISVDSRYLPSGFGANGVLSVYTDEEDCETGITVFSQSATLDGHTGERLYAHAARSLPPPDASPDLNNKAYTDQWMQDCPIYHDGDVVAVLGGWHFPWADGDWEELRERDLLVWTIHGSEPWVEVWRSREGITVMQRST
jgi:hypothetical protein